MYRNLIKSVQYNNKKFKYLTYQTLTVACYHNESSYYGYRPKVKKEWKSMQKFKSIIDLSITHPSHLTLSKGNLDDGMNKRFFLNVLGMFECIV